MSDAFPGLVGVTELTTVLDGGFIYLATNTGGFLSFEGGTFTVANSTRNAKIRWVSYAYAKKEMENYLKKMGLHVLTLHWVIPEN